MISHMLVASMLAMSPKAATAGLGPYRFGMTRAEVEAVPACRPYVAVPGTRGLECRNFTFEGRKMTISFIFAGASLSRIQLWFYEGSSEAEARQATDALLEYLSRRGSLRSSAIAPGTRPTTKSIFERVNATRGGKNVPVRVQISATAGEPGTTVHGSVTRVRVGYFVFIFFSVAADARGGD